MVWIKIDLDRSCAICAKIYNERSLCRWRNLVSLFFYVMSQQLLPNFPLAIIPPSNLFIRERGWVWLIICLTIISVSPPRIRMEPSNMSATNFVISANTRLTSSLAGISEWSIRMIIRKNLRVKCGAPLLKAKFGKGKSEIAPKMAPYFGRALPSYPSSTVQGHLNITQQFIPK